MRLGKISGNGEFTRRCQHFFESRYGFHKCLLTTSCTDALEMAAILLDIKPGDEVIVPSFTFVSTANAFVLRGATILFVDSKQDHPTMDESLIEALITSKTKAIVAVHYGGLGCQMDVIMDIASRYNLFVVEDAAQAIDSFQEGRPLGSFGHLACFSFHETKNIQCGEAGLLVINDPSLVKRAEIIWEKGTDRAAFSRGEIQKYGWKDIGSSFLPSDLSAAFLWAQLENLDCIQSRRKEIWEAYHQFFTHGIELGLLDSGFLHQVRMSVKDLSFTTVSRASEANAHLYFLVFDTGRDRSLALQNLMENEILAVFHYQSLHRSSFAKVHFPGQAEKSLHAADHFSDCLLRLPLFYELPELSKSF